MPNALALTSAVPTQQEKQAELARCEFLEVQVQLRMRGEGYDLPGQHGMSSSYRHGRGRGEYAAEREILRLLFITINGPYTCIRRLSLTESVSPFRRSILIWSLYARGVRLGSTQLHGARSASCRRRRSIRRSAAPGLLAFLTSISGSQITHRCCVEGAVILDIRTIAISCCTHSRRKFRTCGLPQPTAPEDHDG